MKNKGFLLIELLIVALIIAILASIMLPKYQKAIKGTKSAEFNMAIEAAKKNAALYGGTTEQMGNINMRKLQEQIAKQGDMSSINKYNNRYNDNKPSSSEEGSMMIKFED